MPDHFEYIECWADDTIGKPPWSKSCPAGQSCKDDGGGGGGGDEGDGGGGGGDSKKKKGLSKDAKLTIILCCTLIPLVIGIGVLVQTKVTGGWRAVATGAGTRLRDVGTAIRQRFAGT